jgi:L-amino acid N-acyltransferase YncA
MIRYAKTDDAAQVCEIYNHYVLGTSITFEEQLISIDEMVSGSRKLYKVCLGSFGSRTKALRAFVTRANGKGGALTATPSNRRSTWGADSMGRGIGSELYRALLDELRRRKFHTVIGGIALPNDASVALHEKFKFEKIAQFREVGNKFDRWIDVGYWQLLL